MRTRRRGILSVSWCACVVLAGLFLSACQEDVALAPTQVTLHIESQDSALLARLTDLRVSVALQLAAGWKRRSTVSVPRGALRWPVDIPVTPRTSAEADAKFEVLVEALEGEQVLAATRAITGFSRRKHAQLGLSLFLCPGKPLGFTCAPSSCLGLECGVCDALGVCVPVTVTNAEDLPPAEELDPVDAGATDGSVALPHVDAGGLRDAASATGDGATGDSATSFPAIDAGGSAEAAVAAEGGTSLPTDAQTPSEAGALDATTRDAAADAGRLDASPQQEAGPIDATSPVDVAAPVDAVVDAADPIAQARQACLDTVNMYRASASLPALAAPSATQQGCADEGAKYDGDLNLDGGQVVAHQSAANRSAACRNVGFSGQNSCPNWKLSASAGYMTLADLVKTCLAQMWAEGAPPVSVSECIQDLSPGGCFALHGHWINMANSSNKVVACGFYNVSGSTYWINHDFATR